MSAHRIAILTDSTCDLPQELVEQYDIPVLPLTVAWGNQLFRDRVDLPAEEFYRRLATEKELPTTSQLGLADFQVAYRIAQEGGAQAVVAILLNGQFSGVVAAARQAAADAPLPVYVLDSRNATMGLGWQVLAAARAREAGANVTDILAAAERVRERVQLYIGLSTLEYLHRGGRIGNARRLVGNILRIKPVVFVDPLTGLVEAAGVATTRRKSLELMHEKFFEQVNRQQGALHVAVMHGDAPDEAAAMLERVRQESDPQDSWMNITGPVLGINTGPQAIALCGYRA